MKFPEKLKPKNIIKYITSNKKKIVFNTSMFFLFAAVVFTVLFGLFERDGVFKKTNQPTPTPTATPASTLPPRPDDFVFSVNMGSEPSYLNSITGTDIVTKSVLRHMLEGLTRLDSEGKVIPGVALSWVPSEDKLTWTFTLRDNSLWQDNTKVVSEDFKTAIDLHLAAETQSPYKSQVEALFASVECPAENTVIFKLKTPTDNLDAILSDTQFFPIQKEMYDKNKFAYGKEPGGICYNGPWYVFTWEHNTRIGLYKNSKYWNANQITMTQMLFITGGTPLSKYENFNNASGGYDIVFLSAAEIQMYRTNGKTVKSYNDNNIVYLDMNPDNGYLSNENLRNALSLSINRSDLLKNIIKSDSVSVEGYDYAADAATAKASFSQALKDLNKKDLNGLFTITVDNSSVNLTSNAEELIYPSEAYALAIAKYWKDTLGITVNVEKLSYSERIDKIKEGTIQITINSTENSGTLPEAPLYYRYTSYATNERITDIIINADRGLDLYYAKPQK